MGGYSRRIAELGAARRPIHEKSRGPRPMKLPSIPKRADDAHKGDFGKILIIGGSRAMPGAVALAGAAALKSGAGLVKLAVPLSAASSAAAFFPCYTLLPCPETPDGTLSEKALRLIAGAAEESDVIALGPGLSTHPETARLTLRIINSVPLPLVADADALNILALEPSVISRRKAVSVLTPHPGEFARLARTKNPPRKDKRSDAARELARRLKSIILLKGAGTVITDGDRIHIVKKGNPGMATAGSGDVLTGAIAALLHVIKDPLGAAALGAHVHAAAGDLAARSLGQISVTATDILNKLPRAFTSRNK
jgi:NAD(P)H-hydrate epimerase